MDRNMIETLKPSMNSWVSIEIPISYQLYIYTIYYTDIICPFRMTHFHSFPSFVTKTPPERDTTRPEGDSSHVPTHPKRTYNSPGGTKSVFSDRPGRTISSVGYSQVYVGGWGMVNPSFLLVIKVFMKK
jgi:hypothetical protein